jgi:DNA repair protein RadC
VRAALRAVLRESAAPSPDGCAAACLSARRAIPPEQDGESIMNGTNLYTTDVKTATAFRPATLEEIMVGARQALSNRVRKGTALTSPQLTRDSLTLNLAALEHEVSAVILLNGRHRVIEYVELFRGTIDGASVHPREVVKEALRHNAAAVILAHNHPASPSPAHESQIQHRDRAKHWRECEHMKDLDDRKQPLPTQRPAYSGAHR